MHYFIKSPKIVSGGKGLKLKSVVLGLGVRRILERGGGVRFLGVKCCPWGGPGFEFRGTHCFRI